MLTDWGELGLALLIFLTAHALPARPAIRERLVAMVGRRPYIVLYSILSVALLMWIARAAASAPYVELWPYDKRLALAPVVGMVVACLLLVFGLSSPNPLSLGRSAGFDPERPGVAAVVRHPVMWAALIWAAGHIVANGDLAHVIVFGLFALFSIVGMLMLDRRFSRRLGHTEWRRLSRHTSNVPFLAFVRGARPQFGWATAARIAGAAALYAALVFSHEWLAGVAVSP